MQTKKKKTPEKKKKPPEKKKHPATKEKKPSEKKKPSIPEKKKKLTIEYTPNNESIDENKYSDKVKSLLNKIKSQNTDIDKRIRFCWKN